MAAGWNGDEESDCLPEVVLSLQWRCAGETMHRSFQDNDGTGASLPPSHQATKHRQATKRPRTVKPQRDQAPSSHKETKHRQATKRPSTVNSIGRHLQAAAHTINQHPHSSAIYNHHHHHHHHHHQQKQQQNPC